MLDVPVPYTAPATPQSFKYNYPPSTEQSLANSRRVSSDLDRRDSGYAAETDHWFQLAEPVKDAPPVIVFFSFLDSHSKQWALDHQVAHNLRRSLPQGTTVSRYHVPSNDQWDFGETLSHAWAAADSLQVDDKVIGPMFGSVHGKRVTDLEGIRHVFDGVGIPPDMLSNQWMTQKTLMMKRRMQEAVEHLDLKNVPAILVSGKYLVKLNTYGKEFDMDGVVDMVKFLLGKVDVDTSQNV